ncbi:hypothetical protein MUP51_10810, partial [Candidatus Bathyarchaeota archaeon]|nr:hypothetical protein [Candidatus Bathyarchaeota archaeon]
IINTTHHIWLWGITQQVWWIQQEERALSKCGLTLIGVGGYQQVVAIAIRLMKVIRLCVGLGKNVIGVEEVGLLVVMGAILGLLLGQWSRNRRKNDIVWVDR